MRISILLTLLGLFTLSSHVDAAKANNTFSLPNSQGKTVAVGKPWAKVTVLVFFRGDW